VLLVVSWFLSVFPCSHSRCQFDSPVIFSFIAKTPRLIVYSCDGRGSTPHCE